MHVPDNVISPAVCAASAALSATAVGYSIHRLRQEFDSQTLPRIATVSALVFAGQLANFTLPGLPVSGHLVGGVLASALLGPWAGLLAVALVLTVQCLGFGDGGSFALGANLLNMGVVGAWGGHAVRTFVARRLDGQVAGLAIGTTLAAWLSVIVGTALFCVEFHLSHAGDDQFNFSNVFASMLRLHAAIGVGEAVLTLGLLAIVAALGHQTISIVDSRRPACLRQTVLAGLAIVAASGLAAAMASPYPDGLEAVGLRQSFDHLARPNSLSILADYEIPRLSPSWSWVSAPLAGMAGTLVVLLIPFVFDAATRRVRRPQAG